MNFAFVSWCKTPPFEVVIADASLVIDGGLAAIVGVANVLSLCDVSSAFHDTPAILRRLTTNST